MLMEIKIARLQIPCFSICHVLMPPTGEEDAITMALTMWAKSPMNMCVHKIAETECWNKMQCSRTCTNAIVCHTHMNT